MYIRNKMYKRSKKLRQCKIHCFLHLCAISTVTQCITSNTRLRLL